MNTFESDHMMLDLEAEITKITELIRKLTEAEESIRQRLNIITEKSNARQTEISNNNYRKLKGRMDELIDEILWLEKFPRVNYHVTSFHTILTPLSIAKEPAKSVQRLKIKFHHNSKNLATERKMAKELQLREREEQQQYEVQVEEQNLNLTCYRRRSCSGLRPLGNNTNIRSMIRIWAKKVEFVSTLVLGDNKNMTPKWQTRANLNDLQATRNQMYWEPQIGKAEFN